MRALILKLKDLKFMSMSFRLRNDDEGQWIEEELGQDIRWRYRVNSVLYQGQSEHQYIDFVDTPTFGKVLLLDGKMQSTEGDEEIYHEVLVHTALLQHSCPRSIFIMGGGEGATARECLKHKTVEKVVMVDIDSMVTDFCSENLERNKAAFADPRMTLICADARKRLEAEQQKFDVIIGDLPDPLEGGPCYQLYTLDFYRSVVLPKLNPGGIFITQSGPAGPETCKEVFTCIHRTMAQVWPTIIPFTQHIPSFCDVWGFNLAFSDEAQTMTSADELDLRAAERIEGPPLKFLDGETLPGLLALNKMVRKALREENEVYTVDNAKFLAGPWRGLGGTKNNGR